ncbi:MAG TPA: PilZ domain-containing protein [Gemmatimonadales bacterium]|nr:PilZ domain-containing protein [Gemmatimonadales bacterium]
MAYRREGELDRRTAPRAEYRRTAPGFLSIDGFPCAVRDLGPGGLRVEPAPAARVWRLDEIVEGELKLREGSALQIRGRISRISRAGLAIVPVDQAWPGEALIVAERALLSRGRSERRGAPRLPIPTPPGGRGARITRLRDVSATGLRYVIGPGERVPAVGSMLSGDLRLDADTVIAVRGRVVRHMGREVAVALAPPGLSPEVLSLLHARYFGGESELGR